MMPEHSLTSDELNGMDGILHQRALHALQRIATDNGTENDYQCVATWRIISALNRLTEGLQTLQSPRASTKGGNGKNRAMDTITIIIPKMAWVSIGAGVLAILDRFLGR